MRSVCLVVLVGCGATAKSPEDGEVNGVVATCTESACALIIDATLVDLEGEPVQAGLSADEFALSGMALAGDDGTFLVTAATVTGLDAEVTGGGGLAGSLIVDQSGSMESTDPDELRLGAAEAMAAALLDQGEDRRMAALSFPRELELGTFDDTDLLQDFTDDEALLDAALATLSGGAGGGTPLYDSISEVLDYQAGALADGERSALFVLTDGSDSDSSASLDETIEHAVSLGTPVYVAGLGEGVDFDEMGALAGSTGGIFVPAADPERLTDGLEALSRSVYGSVRIQAEIQLDPASDPLTEGWYRVTGSVDWEGQVSMELDVELYIADVGEAT